MKRVKLMNVEQQLYETCIAKQFSAYVDQQLKDSPELRDAVKKAFDTSWDAVADSRDALNQSATAVNVRIARFKMREEVGR